MQVRIIGRSDVGKKREKNEDSFLINEPLNLCIIADGMGGHLGGEFASKLATNTINEVVSSLERDPEVTLDEGAKTIKPGDYAAYLQLAISAASARIFEESHKEVRLKGMGTTSVAILFRDEGIFIANVGDSRAYLIEGGAISQMTHDHSLVGEQLRAGYLSADDAKTHRLKNVITRSVGFQESVEADIIIHKPKEGSRYLLCSDGLSNLIEDQEIFQIIEHNDLADACQRLIDVANERGGDDNITVVLAEVQEVDDDSTETGEDTTVDTA